MTRIALVLAVVLCSTAGANAALQIVQTQPPPTQPPPTQRSPSDIVPQEENVIPAVPQTTPAIQQNCQPVVYYRSHCWQRCWRVRCCR